MLHQTGLSRRLLPLRNALEGAGVPLSVGYEQIRRQVFPTPIKDGRRSLVPSDEVEAVIAARIAGRTEPEIRALVQRLLALRQTGADPV